MNYNDLLDNFSEKKALIIGDSMIDMYMWGDINRMSPEAPVPVIDIAKYEKRLGGAANVALNIKALGAEPILCTVIGNDDKGKIFKDLMLKDGLSTDSVFIDNNRKTTTKTRVIANDKHQIRIDEEDTHYIDLEQKIIDFIKTQIKDIDVVILEDYNKGVLTPKLIKKIISISNEENVPTIVDPKEKNFLEFKNCTVFKPNFNEIRIGMNIDLSNEDHDNLEKTTEELRKKLNAKAIILTLSNKGMCINSKDYYLHYPSITDNVIDVSGAGDTVISVSALCLASNIAFKELAKISNVAGGIVCEEVGVVPINKKALKNTLKAL